MLIFETVLVLLLGAVALSVLAKRANIPYPTLLAVAGALVALIPGVPRLNLAPDLILALFVAPVLLDAAFDTSQRDLRRNWRAILWLVLVAVGLTTVAVALTARLMYPDLSWAAAAALGAILSPPDAVAALAVLAHAKPPHRIRKVLEGESLLNDASALLIYKLSVGAVAAGAFSAKTALPTFGLVVIGSVTAGWLMAWLPALQRRFIEDAPTSIILQFVMTFGAWLVAERMGLSGVVTVVVFGLTAARRTSAVMPARIRVPSFAIWETVTLVLNILAFTLIGLQIRPILEGLKHGERLYALGGALAILGVVIAVRFIWVLAYHGAVEWRNGQSASRDQEAVSSSPTMKDALVVAWSGMRGIVTLAAALALPDGFPYRDFILLTAFVVVLGTLVIQGLTLRPLLGLLRFPRDETVEAEIKLARAAALAAVLAELEEDAAPAAQRLRAEYEEALHDTNRGEDPRATASSALRLQTLVEARRVIDNLRDSGDIGDDAYRRVEEELDWRELSVQPTSKK